MGEPTEVVYDKTLWGVIIVCLYSSHLGLIDAQQQKGRLSHPKHGKAKDRKKIHFQRIDFGVANRTRQKMTKIARGLTRLITVRPRPFFFRMGMKHHASYY